ncbi:MAG: hypothetical protein P8M53_01145 [Pirellulales bacterium]|nr:hypothetical protein [Pirellulales bacterium]
MHGTGHSLSRLSLWLAIPFLALVFVATGCQVNVGGQTLPSPFYLDDDVQYFAPGPEFPLSQEAAAQGIQRAEAGELDE